MRQLMPLIVLLGMAGCQSAAADRPALLVAEDKPLEELRHVIGQMLQTGRVDFGPSDPTQASRLTVLPPPAGQYETRSPAQPIRFDLIIRKGKCLIVRHDTGESRELSPGACVPAAP